MVARCKGPVEFQEVTGCPTEASRTGELVVRVSHALRGIEFRQEPRHPGSAVRASKKNQELLGLWSRPLAFDSSNANYGHFTKHCT